MHKIPATRLDLSRSKILYNYISFDSPINHFHFQWSFSHTIQRPQGDDDHSFQYVSPSHYFHFLWSWEIIDNNKNIPKNKKIAHFERTEYNTERCMEAFACSFSYFLYTGIFMASQNSSRLTL